MIYCDKTSVKLYEAGGTESMRATAEVVEVEVEVEVERKQVAQPDFRDWQAGRQRKAEGGIRGWSSVTLYYVARSCHDLSGNCMTSALVLQGTSIMIYAILIECN